MHPNNTIILGGYIMKKVVDLFQYKLEKEEREEKQNNTELFKK